MFITSDEQLSLVRGQPDPVPHGDATKGKEVERKEKLDTRWAQLEAIVGPERRPALVARNAVSRFEDRRQAINAQAPGCRQSRWQLDEG